MPTLICRLELKNLLSFGPDSPSVEFGPLNVIIGPNGSGKSNLITALAFLQKLPSGVENATPMLGDVGSLIWNGNGNEFELAADLCSHINETWPKYQIAYRVDPTKNRFWLRRELVLGRTEVDPKTGQFLTEPIENIYFNGNGAVALISEDVRSPGPAITRDISGEPEFKLDESILKQRAYPALYPQIHYVADSFQFMAIYRSWTFGWASPIRNAQTTSQRADRVEEDWRNFQLVLNRMCGEPRIKNKVLKYLDSLAPGIKDIGLDTLGGGGTLRITEGERNVTMDRLSDGTLRVLAMLAVFCHPQPPHVIVFEEPELGLHPDMIPTIADLLRDAATRTQVIVTTHSRDLIDCFTATPEVVLVCEKQDGQTVIQPAHAPGMAAILKQTTLGAMWAEGHIGGNRW